jgi:hypothetical protein
LAEAVANKPGLIYNGPPNRCKLASSDFFLHKTV